jgi:hypothetical protein
MGLEMGIITPNAGIQQRCMARGVWPTLTRACGTSGARVREISPARSCVLVASASAPRRASTRPTPDPELASDVADETRAVQAGQPDGRVYYSSVMAVLYG